MRLDRPALATDDRARRIPTLRLREVRAAAEGPDPQRAALARHLRNAINAESRRWTVRGWVVGLSLIAAWISLLTFAVISGLYRHPILGRLFTWGGLIGIGIISRVDARRRVASQLAATAVAEGICGSCCYNLHDLVPEADGCLVCPECGAAWLTRRITRPHWLTAAAPRARAEGGRAGTGANCSSASSRSHPRPPASWPRTTAAGSSRSWTRAST